MENSETNPASTSTDDHQQQQQSKKAKTSQQTQPIEIPILPSEIITEILSRLPVKPLLKFKCVSKSWLALITSSRFIKTHVKKSQKDTNFAHHKVMLTISYPHFDIKHCSLQSLVNKPACDVISTNFPGKRPYRPVWVVGSCNGLVCLAVNDKDLYLWNPSTRKSKKLPLADVYVKKGYFIIHGFGFDEANDDYKVVGIYIVFESSGQYESEVKVYSRNSKTWKTIEDFKGGVPLDDTAKFVNGKFHWLTLPDARFNHWLTIPDARFNSKANIVSLDIESERYGMVEQPDYGEGSLDLKLGVLGKCVCVLSNHDKTCADLWVLKEYGVKESWSKAFVIPYQNDPGRERYSVPLQILPNGEVILVLGSSFVVYNPKGGLFRYPKVSDLDGLLGADVFVESLVSPIYRCRQNQVEQ